MVSSLVAALEQGQRAMDTQKLDALERASLEPVSCTCAHFIAVEPSLQRSGRWDTDPRDTDNHGS